MSDRFSDIETMGEKSDNQYVLALAIAKRVRKLRSGAPPLIDSKDSRRKPFDTAMKEIYQEKITYTLDDDA